MIVICNSCGFENDSEDSLCCFCGSNKLSPVPENSEKVYVDLSRQPLKMVVKSFNGLHPVYLLFVPVFLLILIVKKAFKSPFMVPMLTSQTVRLRQADLSDGSRPRHKSLDETLAWFEKQGFETCLDGAFVHFAHTQLGRLLVNRERTHYAFVIVNAVSGKVNQIFISVLTGEKRVFTVVNREILPMDLPSNMIFHVLPGAAPDSLMAAMNDLLGQAEEHPKALSLPRFLRLYHKVDTFYIRLAIRQNILIPETKLRSASPQASSSVPMCVNHPMNAGVRLCTDCRTALCEACYSDHEGHPYCDQCLAKRREHVSEPVALSPVPDSATTASLPCELPQGMAFAGLGVRLCAKLLDLAVITGVAGLIAFVVYLVLGMAVKSHAAPLAVITFQALLMISTVLYFTVIFTRLGGTPGQRMLGIKVIDPLGGPPHMIAAAVRFGYHIVSAIFLFPTLGYDVIPFRKSRQGIHDRLAATHVITRHPRIKAFFSWIFISVVMASAAYGVSSIMATMFGLASAKIQLEPVWELKGENTYAFHNGRLFMDTVITFLDGNLAAVDLDNGQVLWKAPVSSLESPVMLLPETEIDKAPVVVSTGYASNLTLFCVAPDSGDLLWRIDSQMENARASLQADGLVVWNNQTMIFYDLEGRQVWQQQIAIPEGSHVMINEDVFIFPEDFDAASSMDTRCISMADGDLRWSGKIDASMLKGVSLGKGYHLTGIYDPPMRLYYLPDRREIWTSDRDTGQFVVSKPDARTTDTGLPLLYTNSAMLRGDDGQPGFIYPEKKAFLAATDDWLLLRPDAGIPWQEESINQLTIIDRFSGQMITTLACKGYRNISYLGEDTAYLYCQGFESIGKGLGMKMITSLLLLEKSNLALREITLGENVAMWWSTPVKFIPETQTLFLSSASRMGRYRLPAEAPERHVINMPAME
ncbi:MAG: RDD family protein [Thermodesulfobacteriota bacterium]|nr:RDD family protein [Thermodesulfobacteriota bacterium]